MCVRSELNVSLYNLKHSYILLLDNLHTIEKQLCSHN